MKILNNKTAVIIGFGSIGERHANILKKYFYFKNIWILTNRKNTKKYNVIKNIHELKKINFEYLVISSNTTKHFNQLKYIENNFKSKKILVEKPLFHKYKKLKIKNNKIFVGYNLRFHPIIKYLKKKVKNNKILDVKVICNSFLPEWRKNIKYYNSSSASKQKGGGVVLDLSHELDYVNWIMGNIKINYSQKGKKSKLQINTEDYLKLIGKAGGANFSLDLNYFSRIPRRTIQIDCEKFSIFSDLINNTIEFKSKNKKFLKRFKKLNRNYTYYEQHKEILKNKFSLNSCNFHSALKIMKLIDQIKRN